MRSLAFAFFIGLVASPVAGCAAALQELESAAAAPSAPRVTVAAVSLVSTPRAEAIAGALCPRVAPEAVCALLRLAVGGGGPVDFVFALALDVANDNAVPLPMVEALAAFTAFPDAAGGQNLGAVCLSMCNDPASCPPRADACTSGGGPTVRTLRDFAAASVGFLVAVASGQASLDNLRVRTIAAHSTARVTLSLQLDPQQMLALLERLAVDAVAQLKQGQTPRFAIPYKIEGTVWVDVQGFGRIAAGFGPYAASWDIR